MYHNGTSNSVIQDHEKYSFDLTTSFFQKYGRVISYHTQTPARCGVDAHAVTEYGRPFNVEIKVDYSPYSKFMNKPPKEEGKSGGAHSIIKENKYYYINKLEQPTFYVVYNCDKEVNKTTVYVYNLSQDIVDQNDYIIRCIHDNQSDPNSRKRWWKFFHLPIYKACFSVTLDNQEIHNTLLSQEEIWNQHELYHD